MMPQRLFLGTLKLISWLESIENRVWKFLSQVNWNNDKWPIALFPIDITVQGIGWVYNKMHFLINLKTIKNAFNKRNKAQFT